MLWVVDMLWVCEDNKFVEDMLWVCEKNLLVVEKFMSLWKKYIGGR